MNDPISKETGDMIGRVATYTASRFRGYVDRDDIVNDLNYYAATQHDRFSKWETAGEQHRVLKALRGAARRSAEYEKAEKSGYRTEDIAWYSPDRVAHVLPFALDDGFCDASTTDGAAVAFEGGSLLAMVIDVREALKAEPAAAFTIHTFDEDHPDWGPAIDRLCERLGGEFPDAPGYRRGRRQVLSNEAAVALLEENR